MDDLWDDSPKKTAAGSEMYDVSICMDCLMMAANGEAPETPDQGNPPGWEPLDMVDDGFIVVPSDDEGSFSWSGCDTCSSRLGGTKYDATLMSIASKTAKGKKTANRYIDDLPEDVADDIRYLGSLHYDILMSDWGDPWGAAMGWMFAVNDRLQEEGGKTHPTFRQSPMGADTDSFEYQMLDGVSVDTLETMNLVLDRVTDRLEEMGRDY